VKTKPSEHPAQQSDVPSGEETDSYPTVPVVVSDDAFQALPEGAFVGDETYYITSLRSEEPDQNIYGMEEARCIFPCPNPECGYLENLAGKETCMSCGTPLDGVVSVHRRYQLQEYRDFEAVAMAARVTDLGLSHPGLFLHHYFVERPYGSRDRYYLALPDPTPLLASKIAIPQKVARVLDWGAQLADTLAYLHNHGVGWQQVSTDHIVLRDRRAMWIDFTGTQILSSDQAEAVQQQARDVFGLASVMFYLATGEDTYTPHASLSETAVAVFDRVLGADVEITTAEALAETFKEAVTAIRRPATVHLRVGRHTDVGMVRDLNEDSLLTLELDRVHRSISRPIGLYVVADGMGGHAAGDVASGLVINTIAEKIVTHLLAPQLTGDIDPGSFDAQSWLADAIQAANQAVHTHRQSAGTNMGTTLVAALTIGDMAYIANVGDSRAYLINEDGISQITTDHSLVERLVAMGQITADEARVHPQRNVIYRTIGDKEEAEADFFVRQLKPGDSLLLCSDGLSGKVEDAEIWRLVRRVRSPQEACEQLVQAANDNGGDDNITVIIVQASRQR
jgi:serine/threonine protein phosphatase PrpC